MAEVFTRRRFLRMAGGLAAAAMLPGCARSKKRPNFLLVTLETTRRDHCSLYGYEKPTTPFLAELARESIVFTNAWSDSSWTLPSMASLLSSRLPHEHGVYHRHTPAKIDLLAWLEHFRRAGYRSAAFATNHFVRQLCKQTETGFDRFVWEEQHPAHQLLAHTLDWLDNQKQESGPWLVFWHVMEPHGPYSAPGKWREMFCDTPGGPLAEPADLEVGYLRERDELSESERLYAVGRYDGEIAYADHCLRRLVTELRGRGEWKDTALVLTSDHGEEFGEHGNWGHGGGHTPENNAVPFMIRPAGGCPPRRLSDLVSGLDVVPTLFALAGVDTPAGLSGRNLLTTTSANRTLYMQATDQESVGDAGRYRVAWLWYGLLRGDRFYRRRETPDLVTETLTTREGVEVAEPYGPWRRMLQEHPSYGSERLGAVYDSDPDPETLRELRDLGYL